MFSLVHTQIFMQKLENNPNKIIQGFGKKHSYHKLEKIKEKNSRMELFGYHGNYYFRKEDLHI